MRSWKGPWNSGDTPVHHRTNQLRHFIRRLWLRFNVGISIDAMPDLVAQVKQDIETKPELVVDVQPDGRVLVVTNLGRHGRFPLVFDPNTDALVTVLTWDMLRRYSSERVKRKHERQKRSAEAVVEDLP